MGRSLTIAAMLSCVLAAADATVADAAVIQEATLKELAERSDAVIYGTLMRKEFKANVEGMPWTFYTLSVHDVFAGEVAGSEFTFRCAGGIAGGHHTRVGGVPTLNVGDEVVAFFMEADPICQLAGAFQGVFKVADSASGIPVLVNHAGYPLVGLAEDDLVIGPAPVSEATSDGQVVNVDGRNPLPVDAPLVDATTMLDEIDLFATAFAKRARLVSSVTDFKGALIFADDAAPPPPSDVTEAKEVTK